MKFYFDTSALCRYYYSELGSERVLILVNDASSHCVISWLTILEMHSAFAHKVRIREIEPADLVALKKKLLADVGCRKWNTSRVLRSHYDVAAGLIAKHGGHKRLRSLDALHLGIFFGLRERGEAEYFVTADLILAEVATSEGISVINPLTD